MPDTEPMSWIIAIAAAAAQTPVAGPDNMTPSLEAMRAVDLKAELRTLSAWFPGTYDNHEQVIRQSGHALMPKVETPFHRVHIVIEALPEKVYGPNTFRWTERWGNQAQSLARDEILTASIDTEANALRLKRRRIAGIPEQATALGDACDLLLRYEGGQLTGQLASERCVSHGGTSDLRVIIGPRYVWLKEEVKTKAGKTLWEMAPGTGFDWHQASRARQFSCDVFGDEKGQMASTRFIRKISLHDQGGVAEIPWPDGRTLEFSIHTRAFSIAPTRVHPLFRVHEKGNPVPIAYAYAEDDSDDFGLNLGWFYVRCAAEKPR